MNITAAEYGEMVKAHAPNSSLVRDLSGAFVVGGLICTLGELISESWKWTGLDQDAAASATAITLVFLGALLTGLGIYDKIAKIAGAGTLVPITGFSNAVASPAMEFRSEGLVLGLGAKLFIIAGPVLVYGIGASVIYGFCYFFYKLLL